MSKRYEAFRKKVGTLLFEDSYVTHGTIDNMRAGHLGGEVESDPISDLDLPVDPAPQAATQLSQDLPPIDDPEYTPVNKVELASALSALAKELPDEKEMIGNTYEKFRKFVDDNKDLGIKIVDDGGTSSPKEVQEARKIIKNFIVTEALSDTDLYGNKYDDDPLGDLDGPSDEELEAIEGRGKKKPSAPGESDSLADIAKDMGISTSGVKRLEAEAIKKMRLFAVHFPQDEEEIKQMAMEYFAKGLHKLDLIDAADAADLMMSKDAYTLPSFRQFMWDSFLNNVYKKMLRDAEKQGISEENLDELQPGLLDRARDYFTRLADSKKMKVLVSSLAVAE